VRTYDIVIHALADPTRRSLLERLRDGPRCVVELAADTPVSRPAVSQHLRVLRDAGLVRSTRVGRRRVYALDPGGFEPLERYLEWWWAGVLATYATAADRHPRTTDKE
jgi:DNA-binding transcriptional ArsR family regulator